MDAPCGMVMLLNRIPINWSLVPSAPSSRSVLVKLTLPLLTRCSASSDELLTREEIVTGLPGVGVWVGLAVAVGVAVGVSLPLSVGVDVGVSVSVGVLEGVGVSVAVGVGVGVSGGPDSCQPRSGAAPEKPEIGVGGIASPSAA